MNCKKGKFITLEGGEGAGKSTAIKRLAKYLSEFCKTEVVVTREPGGSAGAEEIRKLLLAGEKGRWDAVSELLLFAAARRDHLRQTILPAIEQGKWVICDRYADSTMAYQGYGYDENKAVDKETIAKVYNIVAGGFVPDVTFILDIPPVKGFERVGKRGEDKTRFEDMDMAFHERLRQGFLDIARKEPLRCEVINAEQAADKVAEDIINALKKKGLL